MIVKSLIGLVLAGSGTTGPILDLQWRSPGAGSSWPLPFVVELCDEHSRSGERLRVEGPAGAELPTRQEVLSSWPGGRPRLVRLVPGSWPGGLAKARCRPSRHPPPPSKLKLQQHGTDLDLRGGPGRDRLTLQEGVLSLGRGGSTFALDLHRVLLDLDGVAFDRHRVLRWQRQGPDPGGVEWLLELAVAGQDVSLYRLRVRIQVPPDLEFLSVECTLTALQTFVLHRWSLPGVLEGPARRLAADPQPAPGRDGSLVWEAIRKSDHTHTPAVDLVTGQGSQRLTCRWDRPGAHRPTRALLRDDGRFRLDLVAGDLMLQQGQTLRHRFLIHRGPRVHHRPQILEPSRAVLGTEQATTAWLQTWQEFLVGWARQPGRAEDRGCYSMPDGSFANGEFDLGGSLLELAGWTGQHSWLEPGLLMVHHTRDWDVAVDPPPPWPPGLRAMHGYRHGSDRVEAGHLWADGLVQEVLLRGTPASLMGARDISQGLLRCLGEPEVFQGPERRLAWPLRVATDVDRLHSGDGQRLAVALLERLAQVQAKDGYLNGDRRTLAGKERIWVNTWVSLGITVESLLRVESTWSLSEAGDRSRRLGAWILAQAIRRGRLSKVLLVDPDTGAVVSRQGGLRAGGAALAASGLLRLADHAVTGGPHLDLAVGLWEQALADLGQPREHDLVEFAKALQALRNLAASAAGRSLILGGESHPRRCSCRVGPSR